MLIPDFLKVHLPALLLYFGQNCTKTIVGRTSWSLDTNLANVSKLKCVNY